MTSQLSLCRTRTALCGAVLKLALALVCIACLPGCGGKSWHADTHPARGRLSVNGEPAAGAVVELHSTGDTKPDDRNSRPWSVVQADGTFDLSTYEKVDGAPLGEYAVVVRWPPDVRQPSLADRLGGAFSSPDKSKWRVTIAPGENDLPPIDIVGVKVLPKEQAASSQPAGPIVGR